MSLAGMAFACDVVRKLELRHTCGFSGPHGMRHFQKVLYGTKFSGFPETDDSSL